MDTNAFVNTNPEWQEPSVLWFILAIRKGEKKMAALKRISGSALKSLKQSLDLSGNTIYMDQSKATVDFSPKLRDKIRNVKPGFEAKKNTPHSQWGWLMVTQFQKTLGKNRIQHHRFHSASICLRNASLQQPRQDE